MSKAGLKKIISGSPIIHQIYTVVFILKFREMFIFSNIYTRETFYRFFEKIIYFVVYLQHVFIFICDKMSIIRLKI